ncbi:HAD-IIB family hydrolase [Estrella lausannensis]|uniref:HAD-superfamily hydrolase n=1 Tax=Estrella lausannensis TaxID=483423 RepID=A0A0H5DPE9_9BACT|nr:HAD family hydrolase [Estrella lausannensis]CRX38426.1 HAD-superfamily hydrolase [Estrella lausannensis]
MSEISGEKSAYIFLDIDGTISSSLHSVEPEVAAYLNALAASGHQLVFVTGRSYLWAEKSLSFLQGSYLFSCQNGALIQEMPSRRVLFQNYIEKEMLSLLDRIAEPFRQDYVVYTGRENNSLCYYRESLFTSCQEKTLLDRAQSVGEEWISVASFRDLPVESFPAVKFFGGQNELQSIADEISKAAHLHIPVIVDPVVKGSFVAQGTMTSKGDVVDAVVEMKGARPVVAAGDDMNDLAMLRKADIKVVVETAPKDLLMMSDIICPPADKSGIITGLSQAIERLKRWG